MGRCDTDQGEVHSKLATVVNLVPDHRQEQTPDRVIYPLLAGSHEALQIQMGTSAGQLRPAVRVFDHHGILICQALSTWSTSVEIPHCLLPQSGRYSVVAGDASATQSGSYTITLTCLTATCTTATTVPPSGGSITSGRSA